MTRAEAMPGFRSALVRLFTIQAAFTYERMLGVGFAFAAEPMLRALGRSGAPEGPQAYRAALGRQSAINSGSSPPGGETFIKSRIARTTRLPEFAMWSAKATLSSISPGYTLLGRAAC